MPQHAPCRNRTYNLELGKVADVERFPSTGTPVVALPTSNNAPEMCGDDEGCATDVQSGMERPLGLLRTRLALPCRAIRAGWSESAVWTPEAA
jgi:hypothetical protein